MSQRLPHHKCNGLCESCDKSTFHENGNYYACDTKKTEGIIIISPNPTMRRYVSELKCYARGCDNNNIDCTCMYGDKVQCHVNCDNCTRICKKRRGERACKLFKRKEQKK